MAPPNSSSFSVSVVLPASGCEMMAKVRRRATSSESGDRDGDSAGTAVSDMNRAFGRENGLDQAAKKPSRYRDLAAGLQPVPANYLSSTTAQYAAAATIAEAGM